MIALRSGESTGHIVRSRQVEGVIVCTTRTPRSGRSFDPHFHERAHLCLIVHGTDVETRSGRSYRRQAGDLHFYHAGEPHASEVRSACVTSALVELAEHFLSRHDLKEDHFARAVHENSNARLLMLQMQHELQQNDAHTPLGLHALALELVNYSRERYERSTPDWVPKVAQLLTELTDAPLSLSDMATACDTHPVTISRRFRRYFGCSLAEYRRRLMIHRSLPLISESTTTLSAVAFACGFADQSHFIRAFRRATHLRPGDYRNL
jgi:AraC family transcriptional regulator